MARVPRLDLKVLVWWLLPTEPNYTPSWPGRAGAPRLESPTISVPRLEPALTESKGEALSGTQDARIPAFPGTCARLRWSVRSA
jgi:hypothetical protein